MHALRFTQDTCLASSDTVKVSLSCHVHSYETRVLANTTSLNLHLYKDTIVAHVHVSLWHMTTPACGRGPCQPVAHVYASLWPQPMAVDPCSFGPVAAGATVAALSFYTVAALSFYTVAALSFYTVAALSFYTVAALSFYTQTHTQPIQACLAHSEPEHRTVWRAPTLCEELLDSMKSSYTTSVSRVSVSDSSSRQRHTFVVDVHLDACRAVLMPTMTLSLQDMSVSGTS